MPEELIHYHRNKEELTLHNGCILWGKHVIIPQKLQSRLLGELLVGHISVCRIKALARNFIWWCGLDNAIEETVAHFESCNTKTAMAKPVARHPWQLPDGPWERVHVDYCEWNNYHLLVLVYAFSKWPEVKVTCTTTAKRTINLLRLRYTH